MSDDLDWMVRCEHVQPAVRSVRTRRTTNARAFTLIELLVVIGIISVLVSILLPAVRAARESALSVNCMASMRFIGQTLRLYTMQQGGFLPIPTWTGVSSPYHGNSIVWTDYLALAGLIKHPREFAWFDNGNAFTSGTINGQPVTVRIQYSCPASRALWWRVGVQPPGSIVGQCYGIPYPSSGPAGSGNEGGTMLWGWPGNKTTNPETMPVWMRISRIRNPSEKVMLVEIRVDGNRVWVRGALNEPADGPPQWDFARHRGGANFLFADGTVRWEKNDTRTTYLSGPATHNLSYGWMVPEDRFNWRPDISRNPDGSYRGNWNRRTTIEK